MVRDDRQQADARQLRMAQRNPAVGGLRVQHRPGRQHDLAPGHHQRRDDPASFDRQCRVRGPLRGPAQQGDGFQFARILRQDELLDDIQVLHPLHAGMEHQVAVLGGAQKQRDLGLDFRREAAGGDAVAGLVVECGVDHGVFFLVGVLRRAGALAAGGTVAGCTARIQSPAQGSHCVFGGRIVGGDPYALVALPGFCADLAEENLDLAHGDRRHFQREGMVGALHDEQARILDLAADQFVAFARREEVEFTIHDQGRYLDLVQVRRQRLELDEGFHQVLHRVAVVADVAGALHGRDALAVGGDPRRTHVHRVEHALQVGQADLGQALQHDRAEQVQLRGQFGEGAHRRQAVQAVPVADREIQRDDAAEGDAGEMGFLDAQLFQQVVEQVGVHGQFDVDDRLRRAPLAEHVVGQDAVAARHEILGVALPQIGVLGQAVEEGDDRPARFAGQFVMHLMVAVLGCWHGAPREELQLKKGIDQLFNATIMMAPAAQ